MIFPFKAKFNTFLFMVKVQWEERKLTSSYVIGMTVQLFVFCLALLKSPLVGPDLLSYALKLGLFIALNILTLSAMSNITNEYRDETMAYSISSYRGL